MILIELMALISYQDYHMLVLTLAGNTLVGLNVRLPSKSSSITLAQWQAQDPAHNDVGSTYKNVSVARSACRNHVPGLPHVTC